MEFNERLRNRRKLLGISRRELSEVSGISTAQISNYEDGKSHPTLPALIKISNALGISPKIFFDMDSEIIDVKSKIEKALEEYDVDLNLQDLEEFHSLIRSFLNSKKISNRITHGLVE